MSKYASRILAIDDEPRILRFLQSNLQLASYTVQTAAFGTEGLKLALETAPDLVLLDLGLPDLDGLEVLRRLRLQSDAPVIIITARDDEESMVAGLKLGADDYLTKPFSGRALQARIEAVLRRYHSVTSSANKNVEFQSGPLYVDVSQPASDAEWGTGAPDADRILAADRVRLLSGSSPLAWRIAHRGLGPGISRRCDDPACDHLPPASKDRT